MDINGHVCLISGGASGLGAATAEHLFNLGARIAILDRDIDAANIVAENVSGIALRCDVANPNDVETAVAKISDKIGSPRVCINCAGVDSAARIVGKDGPMPLDDFANAININLVGTFNVMRIAAHAMSLAETMNDDGERGVIINTASIAAFDGQIGQAAYSASKGGVVAMTLPAARELSRFGIRVMTIAPGLVDTPMLENLRDDIRNDLQANIPFPKRFGKPMEFAMLVQQIIENPLLNGETIRLDGALRMMAT